METSSENLAFSLYFFLLPLLYVLLVAGAVYGAVLLLRYLKRIAVALENPPAPAGRANISLTDENGVPVDNHESLRLQACERFTLLMERIAIPNLLLRIPPEAGQSAKAYTATLLLAIREEFEYNTTQQIYVSDALWSIIIQARDNVSLLITRAAEGATDGEQVANRLRHMSSRQPEDAVAVAQSAIRREASSVLGR